MVTLFLDVIFFGGGHMMVLSKQKLKTYLGPMKCYIVKENHPGLAVSEIIQTYRFLIICFS